jgi:hypothetical protein
MKTWFAKFRISTAFDSGRPLPRWVRRRLSGSEELRSFAMQMSELESALQEGRPVHTPNTLHGSIMRAVRGVQRARGVAPRAGNWVRWLPVPAMTVVVLCVLWWFWTPTSPNRPFPSLAQALDAGATLTETLPAQLVDPLNEEWQRVNLDLEDTRRFLLASVPF